MGNFKKISAAVVAGAIMLSSVVPTFAAAYTPVNGEKASVLNQLELYAGTSDTSFVPSLETSLTRGQGATLLAKLFNMDTAAQALTEDEANAILKDFADADKIPTYAKKRLAYLVKNNIMSGSKDTTTGDIFVNADEALLGGQFATLILKQLGYTVSSWTEAINQLSKVDGAKEIADYLAYAQKSVLRDQAVGIMFGSLTSEYSDGKATIIDKIVEAKPNLRAIAESAGLISTPAVLAVDSVKALNLKQIQVVFNKTVDKSVVEKIEYFNAFNSGSSTDLASGGSVALQADGKTAIVTLGSNFNNGTVAKVVVKTIATYTNDSVAVADTTVPTVAGVTVTGPQTITVEYSEPIKGINSAEYTIDNGNYIVTNAVANGSNKVDVTVGVNFTNGEHSLRINGTNVSDYADYKVISRTINFTVAADTTAPVATVKSVSPTEVKVTFNKPVTNVKEANVLFRHTYNSNLYELAGNNAKVTVNSSTEITIDWSAMPIPLGANKLYIAYSSDTGAKIQDLWGNKLEALSLELAVSMDTVKPAVTEVKFVDASTLKVIFSKKVEEASAETASNFIVKDSAGKVVTLNTPVLGGADVNEVTLTTSTANALGGGSYTVEVKNVKDTALVPNVMDAYNATLNINDTVRPTLGTAKHLIDSSDANHKKATVYIPFSEVMDAATLVKANFMKVVNNGTAAVLGDNDTLTVAADKKSVTIVIDNGTTAVTDINVVIGAVRDAAGNGLAAFAANADPEADAIAIEKVEAIAKKQIKVTYDGRLSAVTAAGYSLIANGADTGINLSVAGHTVNSDGKSEVIFNLGTELSADAKSSNYAVSLVASSAAGTKSFLGTVLSNNAGKQADDKIAASIVSVTVVGGTIEVKFDEAIKADTLAATLNGFSVTGGDAKLTTVALKGGDATTIVLTGTGLVANQTSVTYNSAAGIADNGSNLIASFTQIAK